MKKISNLHNPTTTSNSKYNGTKHIPKKSILYKTQDLSQNQDKKINCNISVLMQNHIQTG